MKPLRILITNHTMAERRGPAMFVRDLAWNLFRRGHQPVVYAPELGEVSAELRAATIPVADDLRQITAAPDVIIGNAHPDAVAALLTFPAVPGVFVCHAWEEWHADPPKFPRLRRYVAVDETCRDWLVSQKGIPEDRVRLIYNAVDLDRFAPRDPLPSHPSRAAVFSNSIGEATGLGILREACRRAGIALDVMGQAANGKFTEKPEEKLGQYDLVFGKGRCAIEAMAVGCCVILCDGGKLGGIVTSQNWPDLRRVNFGRRAIRHKLDVEHVTAEIAKFDRQDARDVSRSVRSVAGLDDASASLLEFARDAMAENVRVGSPGPEAELRAAAEYLCAMELFRENVGLRHVLSLKDAELAVLREAPAPPPPNNEIARLQHELAASQGREANLQKDLQAIYDSPAARAVLKLSGLRNSAPR